MNKKILILEDDVVLQKAIGESLKLEGFSIIKLLNGSEAVKKIKEEKPSLILLDLLLPEKNGYEILVEIKKNKKTSHIPVIVMSVIDTKSSIEECMTYGADDYLIKSNYTLEEMIDKIKKQLKK